MIKQEEEGVVLPSDSVARIASTIELSRGMDGQIDPILRPMLTSAVNTEVSATGTLMSLQRSSKLLRNIKLIIQKI